MKYNKISLPTYNIHIIETKKFKTVTVKVNFKRALKKEEIAYRNVLINVLCESTSNYPTKRLMEMATENLYDLSYQGSNYISGKYSIVGFDIAFLNERYTEPGIFDKSLDFLISMLFHPNLDNSKMTKQFNKRAFDMAYNLLESNLKSLKESPAMYSKIRMLECMEPNTEISLRGCGYIEDLEKIDAKKLYKYYESMLKKDIVDIFVIGDVDTNKITKIIEKKFNINTLKKQSDSHFLVPKTKRLLVKTVKEKSNYSQSQLVMGFKLNNLSDFELRYVLNVYSYILGGGPDSKLFKNIREKNSLCYSISSAGLPLCSLLVVTAGINAQNYSKTVSLVKKEIKQMMKGDFGNEDIVKAKVTYLNSLKELEDNPQSILSMYTGMEYLNSHDISQRINNINKVTKSDVVNLANKVHLDTIYLLEGGEQSGKA
ncbi:MAG: insulinase family protein [Bacilli bacterium]|nr:insulinase family protein [Bacilli bacterium]